MYDMYVFLRTNRRHSLGPISSIEEDWIGVFADSYQGLN